MMGILAITLSRIHDAMYAEAQKDDDDNWEAYADEICRKDCLVEDLEAASAGAVGKPTQAAPIGDSRDTSRRRQQASARVLAQLRSQRASGAMAWMSVPPTANDRPGAAPMSSMAAATMILIAIFIDGWGIQGEILIELSISLARELAERVMAYTRGARMLGCVAAPVSKLLGHSAD
ncbi:hypothetical protein JKP88DRAFT_285609 [Tribonema minus]|uniref:Uncharacterized protein n=1 Tax=Tribonema minus TaxID=303371 RepID=A0A836CMK1_9STRA|nr:hypothetical protein JKP88DRAFT_285609 [Tribonema minus]